MNPSSVFQFSSFRSYLEAILAERRAKNQSYSIRAFARALGVDHSTLIRVVKGELNFSSERARMVGEKLGLTGSELEYFCALSDSCIKSKDSEGVTSKIVSLKKSSVEKEIDPLRFRMISEWYHFALLQMIQHSDKFQFSPKNAASSLCIDERDVRAGLKRLRSMGLITFKGGRYNRTAERFLVQSEDSNLALQEFHRQSLKKAHDQIGKGSPQSKYNGTETFAFDSRKIAEVSKVINEALDRVMAVAGTHTEVDSIYHLNVSFFSIAANLNALAPEGEKKKPA